MVEQALDLQQPATPSDGGAAPVPQAPIAPSKPTGTGWRSSLAVVGLCWFAVALVAVFVYAGSLVHFVTDELAPLVAFARNAAIVPTDPGNDPGSVLCRDVAATEATRLSRGFALMRRTREGDRLYEELIGNNVCVTVRDLTYYAGLALPRQAIGGGWGHSTIEIDREQVDTAGADVLAATLVHEATHIDRSIQGTNCLNHDDCTVLDNGVVLDEEVAAHAAEARWWLAAYGRRGKTNPDSAAAWENQIAAAYLAGPATFEEFVESFRSDPIEGTSR
ncbi:MAG TPA: hypothetical protein VH482_14005 [Thermomicrobiales bacterium]|jgi:hypothetical protein